MHIDLNCDLGEQFGPYRDTEPLDDSLMGIVTSVNIACGFHSGDFSSMHRCVANAVQAGVAIGAHPGFLDLQGFGRREIRMTADEVYDATLYQVGALDAFVRVEGGKLRHVKPHGALYNMAAGDPDIANAVVRAIRDYDDQLFLYGQAQTRHEEAARLLGIQLVAEAFADRRYQPDGLLANRNLPGAVITDVEVIGEQAVSLATDGTGFVLGGGWVHMQAETICLHGDTPGAVENGRRVKERLLSKGIQLAAPR